LARPKRSAAHTQATNGQSPTWSFCPFLLRTLTLPTGWPLLLLDCSAHSKLLGGWRSIPLATATHEQCPLLLKLYTHMLGGQDAGCGSWKQNTFGVAPEGFIRFRNNFHQGSSGCPFTSHIAYCWARPRWQQQAQAHAIFSRHSSLVLRIQRLGDGCSAQEHNQ
jgi:hypothetical protein